MNKGLIDLREHVEAMNGCGVCNLSRYRMELRRSNNSYTDGNFGVNQLLDGWNSLSHLVPTIDLHVRGGSDFNQSFLWFHSNWEFRLGVSGTNNSSERYTAFASRR